MRDNRGPSVLVAEEIESKSIFIKGRHIVVKIMANYQGCMSSSDKVIVGIEISELCFFLNSKKKWKTWVQFRSDLKRLMTKYNKKMK